jgi:endoglycosylceramidase
MARARVLAATIGLVALALVAACAPAEPPPTTMPGEGLLALHALRGSPGRIVDSAGRDVQLRGVNVNSLGDYFQVDPRLPQTQALGADDFAAIAARGYDVIRLVTTWSAWEPERGVLDEAYADRVAAAIDGANAAGLYVVIDMHQDAWSSVVVTPRDVTCPEGTRPQIGWDGAPAWATITGGASTCGEGGGPGTREENPAVKAAWTSFYTDVDGVRSALADLWGRIAERFGTGDGVAGYDLLNEPGSNGDWGQSESGLVGFYQQAIAAIRAGEDRAGAPHRLVFFEGIAGTAPITPFDFSNDPNLVFAPHNYAESIGPSVPGLLELLSQSLLALGRLYRTPVWVGEYGAFSGDPTSWFTRFGRASDGPGSAGGAWWLWESECGDPHALADIWPPTEAQVVARAATCGTSGHADPPCAARSFPIAAPGLATFDAEGCGGRLRVAGRARGASRLDVWYQPPRGADPAVAPTVSGSGAGTTSMEPTAVGWRVSIQVDGSYDITVGPVG